MKSKMIDAIIGEARKSATLNNKPFDAGDLFFTLAFSTDAQLKKICKSLKIKVA